MLRGVAYELISGYFAYEGAGQFSTALSYLERARGLFRELSLAHKIELAQQALDRCLAAHSSGDVTLHT
jgi:hypothetical protein